MKGTVPVFRLLKMGTVPVLLCLAGCAASPPPREIPAPQVPPPAPLEFPGAVSERNDSDGARALRAAGEQLADFALQLRGLPYRYGGATRDGFDCSGLVFYTHRQFGVSVPRTSRDQARAARVVKERKLQRGDLVFFKIGSRLVNHVGIYVGDRHFLHAPGAGKAVTVNSLDDDYYAKRFSSAGRYWDPAAQ
jgi:cell wall-associated NlpC family hydrolase